MTRAAEALITRQGLDPLADHKAIGKLRPGRIARAGETLGRLMNEYLEAIQIDLGYLHDASRMAGLFTQVALSRGSISRSRRCPCCRLLSAAIVE